MSKLKVGDKKTLFVMPEYNDNVYLSFRNIPKVNGILLSDINTYDLMNADVLVMTESAAKIFSEQEKEA
jgi:large subunit ribosomal protein L4